jgi:hypothetical protein
VDKKEYHIFFLKSIEQQHLFYESAYNESAYKKCPRQRKKGVKALTFYRACKRLQKKKKKDFPLLL